MKSKNSSLGFFSGIVYAHLGRGKDIGFPTANVKIQHMLPHGVYISRTLVGNEWHPSITFIGIPPTFEEDTMERTETHILRGSFELVGQKISVELLKFLRKNQKFSSIQDLIQAITSDKKQALQFFA